MNKRIAKKVYRRTMFKDSMPWGQCLTDREREAHRIWFNKCTAFRVDLANYSKVVFPDTLLREYLKDVQRRINRPDIKNLVAKAILDMRLYGSATVNLESM